MLTLDHVGFFYFDYTLEFEAYVYQSRVTTLSIWNRESPQQICHEIPIIRNSLRTTGFPHNAADYQLQSNYE